MKEDIVVAFRSPDDFKEDQLTDVLRIGTRKLLPQAVEAEVETFLKGHGSLIYDTGQRRVLRNGYLPERDIQIGSAIRFTSAILPPYLRRAKSLEDLLPWLYPKGISSGDFSEALTALLGTEVPVLSASSVAQLKGVRQGEMDRQQQRGHKNVRFAVHERLDTAFRERKPAEIRSRRKQTANLPSPFCVRRPGHLVSSSLTPSTLSDIVEQCD